MRHKAFTDADVAAIAARADVDRRTVVRVLAGLPVKGRPGRRIAAVVAEYRQGER